MTKRQDLGVVIQALKKAVAFQDDLVKKLAGVALIERAIESMVDSSFFICPEEDSLTAVICSSKKSSSPSP